MEEASRIARTAREATHRSLKQQRPRKEDATEGALQGLDARGAASTRLQDSKPQGSPRKKQDGDSYKTATLVVGSSMGPLSVLGRSRAQSLKARR